MSRTRSRNITGYLLLAPYLILFLVFMVLPLVYGLILSFMQYEMISPLPPHFVGLSHYIAAFHDHYFWKAMSVTCIFVFISVPITIVLALALAAGIERTGPRRQNLYRLALFIPMMITISVAGILWRWFFNSEFGVFNGYLTPMLQWFIHCFPFLAKVINPKIPWLLTPNWAMASIILMTIWWTIGAPVVILEAGLKQIPAAYYEAASLDGAVGYRRFFYITLPLLRPVLLFVTVMSAVGAFQIFGQPFIITKGGPELSTRVMMQYIYETSFNNYRLGYGAAMSWLLFIVIAIFSIIQFRVLREK